MIAIWQVQPHHTITCLLTEESSHLPVGLSWKLFTHLHSIFHYYHYCAPWAFIRFSSTPPSLPLNVCLLFWLRVADDWLSLRSLKLSCLSRYVGFTSPVAIALRSCSLLSFKARRMSGTFYSTICLKSGAKSAKAVSSGSSNQDLIEIPFSGWSRKFSVMLSTIMVLSSYRPSCDRSLMNTSMHWMVWSR